MQATAPWQLQLPASNNWVISGKRTESGMPLLANDPHLGFTAPSIFYLAHLKYRDSEARTQSGWRIAAGNASHSVRSQ